MDATAGLRQRLIDCATDLLAAEGVAAVTLRRIAAEAGVSHGAPLRHFTGRAELLSAAAAAGFADLTARLAAPEPTDVPETTAVPDNTTESESAAEQRLRAVCHAFVGFAAERPAMFELMFRHDLLGGSSPVLAAARAGAFARFGELVAAFRGAPEDAETRLLTISLWSSLQGLTGLWSDGGLRAAAGATDLDATLALTLDVYLSPTEPAPVSTEPAPVSAACGADTCTWTADTASLGRMTFAADRVVPVLRIFDLAKAREFYVDYLGFAVDWEHRFGGAGPVYLQVSRGSLVLHLSEHHGDGSPGGLVYVYATGVRELHAELAGKDYPYLNPGIEPSAGQDEGGACLNLLDPFGNTLRIDERGD